MWPRHLLFALVMGGGALLLWGHLEASFDRPRPPRLAIVPVTPHDSPEIDATFREAWNSLAMAPAGRADELTIARRMSLALVGQIPSLAEIRQLESEAAGSRVDNYLERLLADRRSAEYLAERLARAFVGTDEGPFVLFRRHLFVSWLADQLAVNRPFDALVRELITSNGLWTDTPATNFMTVSLETDRDAQHPNPVRLAGRLSRNLLALRLDCAECHDHPFEPQWTQEKFHSLAAFFSGVEVTLAGVRNTGRAYDFAEPGSDMHRFLAPAVPYQAKLLPADGLPRQRLAAWVTHRENRSFARATVNRIWALLLGRPLFEPIDHMPPDAKVPPVLDQLADDFVAHGYDLRRLLRTIASCAVFRLDGRGPADTVLAATEQSGPSWAADWLVFPTTALRPEQLAASIQQAASLTTNDTNSALFFRTMRWGAKREFVASWGDPGEAELEVEPVSLKQRLQLMNGNLVHEATKENIFQSPTQIANFATSDAQAIETAFLVVLSRRPTAGEAAQFAGELQAPGPAGRTQRLEDLFAILLNTAEFACNR